MTIAFSDTRVKPAYSLSTSVFGFFIYLFISVTFMNKTTGMLQFGQGLNGY